MKLSLILCLLFHSFLCFSANEKRNLSILMENSSARMHSLDPALNQKILADELNKTISDNKCEHPRKIVNEDRKEEIHFEDCFLLIKKKSESIGINYQIKTKFKNGKSKSILRKKMLKASYL